MIETRLRKKCPFVIEAYESETDELVGRNKLTRELDPDYLGRIRVVSDLKAFRRGVGIGSLLVDATIEALEEYATRKQRTILHDVTISSSAPHYLGAMFERRGYEHHADSIYTRVYEPRALEPATARLEKKIKERCRMLKKRVPFIN